MENFDIQKIISDFKTKLTNGELKIDILHNSFPPFDGDIVKLDDEAFDRFRKSETYKKILEL